MVKAGKQVLEAFSALQGNPYFERIMEWVDESQAENYSGLLQHGDGPDVYRAQGTALALTEIQNVHATANKRLEQFK